jgi:hypothetical protein
MAVEKQAAKQEPEKQYTVLVCPNCGKTVHVRRKYCACHTLLTSAPVKMSEDPPEVKACNFETRSLTCDDCPEFCKWCAGFGALKPNRQGFGGYECLHKEEWARCYCCQAQVKIVLKIVDTDFSGFIIKTESNVFYELADFVSSRIEKPVSARINRERDKAAAV